MIRWNYVVPRVVGLVLVVGGLWLFGKPLIHWLLEQGGSRALGARVEAAEAGVNLHRSKLEIIGLQITNPGRPTHNLIQCDRMTVFVDPWALAHGKLVVREGHLAQPQFQTRRAETGELSPDAWHLELIDADFLPAWETWLPGSAAASEGSGLDWLAVQRLQETLEQEIRQTQLESVTLVQQTRQRWQQQADAWKQYVQNVQMRLQALQQRVEGAQGNVLQRVQVYQQAAAELVALAEEVQAARLQLEQLPQALKADVAAIEEAGKRDVERLRERIAAPLVDALRVAETMLDEELRQSLGQALQLVKLVREQWPTDADADDLPNLPGRGQTIHFPGAELWPDVLLKKVQLSGHGSLNHRHPFLYRGTLENLALGAGPRMAPVSLSLQVSSPQPHGDLLLEVTAEIDRRGRLPHDQLTVAVSGLRLRGRTLGDPTNLALELPPQEAELTLTLTIEGDKIRGQVDTLLSPVGLDVAPVTVRTADAQVQAWLQSMAADSLPTRVELAGKISGSLAEPKLAVSSPWPEQLAEAINQGLKRRAASLREQIAAAVENEVQGQIAGLSEQIAPESAQWLSQLEQALAVAEQVRRLTGSAGPLTRLPR